MANNSGLFENPHKSEDLEQEQQVTLRDIKDDTGAIKDILYRFGGKQIELAENIQREQKSANKQQQGESKAVLSALKKGILTQSSHQKTSSSQSIYSAKSTKSEQAVRTVSFGEKSAVKKRLELEVKANKQAEIQRAKVRKKLRQEETKEELKQAHKQAAKSASADVSQPQKTQANQKETLPNGWVRGDDGKIRDKNGKFVSGDELKKHDVDNASEDDTEKDAQERRLLDMLGGIKSEIGDMDNVDPMVNAFNEVKAPLAGAFNIGKAGIEVTGRGLGKIGEGMQKSARWSMMFFRFFRRSSKDGEKKQNAMVDWLKRIWKKPNGEGLLGKLAGGLGLLGGGLLGGAARAGGGLLGGLLGGLGGMLGKGGKFLGKMGKGFLKKIPVLGALYSIGDGIAGLFDDTQDEQGRSNRGKRVGGAVGAIAGGVLGAAFGPVGMAVGAMAGDFIGEKVGAWLATLNWTEIGKNITDTWNTSVQFMSDVWNATTDWFKTTWEGVSSWASSTWDSISLTVTEKWGEFTAGLKSTFEGLSNALSSAWDGVSKTVGEKLGQAKDWIVENTPQEVKDVVGNVADKATNAYEFIKDKAVSAYNGTKDAIVKGKDWLAEKGTSVSGWVGDKWESAKEVVATQSKNDTSELKSSTEAEVAKSAVSNAGENIAVSTKDLSYLENDRAVQEEISQTSKIDVEKQSAIADYLGNILTTLGDIYAAIKSGFVAGSSSFGVNPDGTPVASGGGGIASGNFSAHSDYNGGVIDGLSLEQTQAYMGSLAMRESGNDQRVENQYGYMGAYQFGADALSDVGMVDKQKWLKFKAENKKVYAGGHGKSAHARFLADPSNWLIQGGKEAFLNNRQIQDTALIRLTNNNAKTLSRNGVYGGTAEHKSGLLMASHLKGAGNAIEFAKHGTNSRDANGTGVEEYYNRGMNAMKKVSATPTAGTATLNSQAISPPAQTLETHTAIPRIEPPRTNYVEMAKQVEARQAKPHVESATNKENNSQPKSADPIFQYLTQDVSERRIAHIVTGGLLRKNYL